MTVNFRSKQVDDFTVTELSMRLHLLVLKECPQAGIERAAGYLGYAVTNGSAQPIGRDAALELPPALFNELMDAYMEVSKRYEQPQQDASKEGSAEGNA